MSGSSLSFTFPIATASADTTARAIVAGDTGPLDAYCADGSKCFRTNSRNNWIEYSAHRLVTEFASQGLSHLSACFAGRAHPVGGFFANALHGDHLGVAIDGMRQLIGSIRSDIARTSRALGKIYLDARDLAMLDAVPSSIAAAQSRFDACTMGGEGDDFPAIAAFLQGHLVVLEAAREATMSALYVGYIY